MTGEVRPIWRRFVLASLAFASTAGFGLGAGLFFAMTLDVSLGTWWPAAAQTHGHIQIVGLAGLMVIGVAFHFLPRLSGAPAIDSRYARAVLWLFAGGLALRILTQPLSTALPDGIWAGSMRAGWVLSAFLEATGGALASWLLITSTWRYRIGRKKAAIRPLLPFVLTAFVSLAVLLVINLGAGISSAFDGRSLVDRDANHQMMLIGFYGFLIPISIAMSTRTFPLYFRTPAARFRLLHPALGLLIIGLVLRGGGELLELPTSIGAGLLLQALALCLLVAGIGIFASRRPIPRRTVHTVTEPVDLHAVSSYVWLSVAALALALNGLSVMEIINSRYGTDLEVHLLGAGFVFLLILGVGSHLLPGFARLSMRDRRLAWLTLALGNLAVVLRIMPEFLPSDSPLRLDSVLPGTAGVLALIALATFAVNTGIVRTQREARPATRNQEQPSP